MLNLKIATLVVYLLIATGVGAGGSALFISMNSSASADATAVLNCKQPIRPAEPRRHADTVNSGRDKEF